MNIMEFQNFIELRDVVHIEMKMERQLKRKGSSWPSQWVLYHLENLIGRLIWDNRDSKKEEGHLH